MYAIVKAGGKQYRVEEGDSLLVDRMGEEEGTTVTLEPLLFRGDDDGETVFEGSELEKVKVEAVVAGHERGKKLHVLKFKPKRGYKRRTGHRADLTRLEVREINVLSRRPRAKGGQGGKRPGDGEGGAKARPGGDEPAAKRAKDRPSSKRKEKEDGS
jgi:large subunit ribosomal protein L21